jgi:hypothetical protein
MLSFALVVSSLVAADDRDKKGGGDECLTKAAVGHKDAVYDFKYDSWVRANDDSSRFIFGRCVLAQQPRKMWVEWKNVGVKGYTDPDDGIISAGIQSLTKESVDQKAELWYGGKPKKEDTNVLSPKEEKAAKGGSLKSYARMNLGKEPSDAQEETGNPTVKVDFEFESTAFSIGKEKWLYTFSWRDRNSSSEKTVKLDWPPSSIVSFAANYSGEPGEKEVVDDRVMLLRDQQQGVRLVAKSPPTYDTVVVTFKDKDKNTIGSTSVSVFRPKEVKP